VKAAVVHDGAGGGAESGTLLLVPDRNLVTGRSELARALGGPLTSLEDDLMLLASSVFATDLAAKRGEREHHSRTLQLTVPVANLQLFERLRDDLAVILYLLSDDNWIIDFVQGPGTPEAARRWDTGRGKTLLFSGGLDSLAAAVEIAAAGEHFQLASHYTSSPSVVGSQRTLFEYLRATFPGQVERVSARVTGRATAGLPFPSDDKRETSQRTRSFMFLAIGAITARRTGYHELVMIAENGQMAIHLPLSPSRIGAFSTHTAHPEFVHDMEQFLCSVLSTPLTLRNPFLYRTKAECVARLVRDHRHAVERSVSCWRGSRQALNHCGICVPCLIRRIALETHGLRLAEYERDLLSEDVQRLSPDDDGKRNLNELGDFIRWFGGGHPDADILDNFPDLHNEFIDREAAMKMYKRFAREARAVLTNYPLLEPVLT
jgi:7-cyano-7-deazaguanine synthase in queuosine biosynthesis